MPEIPDAHITIGNHVWIMRTGEFRSVAAARKAWLEIEASLPPDVTVLHVSGPVAADKPVAVGEDEADEQAEAER